jgi:hypothetical protein
MPLLPRWQYMTPEAKALVRRAGWSLLALIVVVGLLRALFGPWSLLLLLAALGWIWLRRS